MANIDKIRLSGQTYDIVDSSAIHSLDGYWTSGQTNSAITASTAALAETIGEQGYQTSGDVQNAISGKADTSAVTSHTSDSTIHVTSADKSAWNAKAEVSDIPSVSGYADSVKYDSNAKTMTFYHGGTGGTAVYSFDASPFLIDGMVQNVEIKNVTSGASQVTCLVISFNTDAGKQDINIPISDIFDASNYYTKSQTDDAIEQAIIDASGITSATVETMITAAVSGKADSSDVTALNNVVTAHTANTDVHVTTSDKSNWNGKADAATTLSGYGITNAYTKTEVDSALGGKNQVITLSGTTLVIS